MDREELEQLLAQGMSLAQIGRRFGRSPSGVEYWVRKHGLDAAHRDRHAARGGVEKRRLEALVARGLSARAIADEVGVSHATVRYWLAKYGLETPGMRRRRAGLIARVARGAVQMECRTHGLTDFVREGRGTHRCLRCRSERVSRRRRRIKARLVQEAGGRCQLCGYSRCDAALGFHHLDPATKSFGIGENHTTQSLVRLREEVRKCVLLCANCHAEVEAGVATVVAPAGPL